MVDWECCIFCFGFCRSSPLLFRESKGDCTRSCFRTFYCKGGSVSKHADFTLSTPEPSWRFVPTCERRDCGELLWNLFTSKVKSLLLAKTGERHEWMGFVAVGTRICKSNTANIMIMWNSLPLHTWHLLEQVSRMTKLHNRCQWWIVYENMMHQNVFVGGNWQCKMSNWGLQDWRPDSKEAGVGSQCCSSDGWSQPRCRCGQTALKFPALYGSHMANNTWSGT